MPISTIVFDMGGVLLDYDAGAEFEALGKLLPHGSLSALGHYLDLDLRGVYTGSIRPTDIHASLVQRAGFTGDYAAFAEAACAGFVGVIDGIEPIVEALATGYNLALITNTNAVHWEHAIREHGTLLDRLQPHFVSCEIGMAKPDRRIFDHVAAALGESPSQCLFIDDLDENVLGAQEAGWDAIQFTNARNLVRDLADRGIVTGQR